MIVDINCDLGEYDVSGSEDNDGAVMPFITSANIACGLHAGSPLIIERTIRLALRHGVGIGAHPGYPDRDGFGRRSLPLTDEELKALLIYQVGALKVMAESNGAVLQHVKPHGALYNDAAADLKKAMVIAMAVKEVDPSLILIGMSGSQLINAAVATGLPFASEVFADRAYADNGTLLSRNIEGAVIEDPATVVRRVTEMIKYKRAESVNGVKIPVMAETICLHGDNRMAVALARNISEALMSEGVILKSIGERME